MGKRAAGKISAERGHGHKPMRLENRGKTSQARTVQVRVFIYLILFCSFQLCSI